MRPITLTIGLLGLAAAGCATAPVVKRSLSSALGIGVDRDEVTASGHRDAERASAAEKAAWRPTQGISLRWSDIVIHHSGAETGDAESLDAFHSTPRSLGGRGWDELGYHFVIGNGTDSRDGEVEVGPRWRKQKHGAHCKTPDNWYNDHGIGICLVGNFDDHPPSPRQVAALTRLIRFLMAECDLSVSNVRTHGGVTSQTACPGSRFVLADLVENLRGPVLVSSQ